MISPLEMIFGFLVGWVLAGIVVIVIMKIWYRRK